ncbi:hypothetical protein CCMA1212_006167 [Trichoderma ghanense]|uniref:Uncharacterized protein n=1 Tax=Trichoderma ghanense TaxID=65468 RepID=A0ABY2H2N4_9HYPO
MDGEIRAAAAAAAAAAAEESECRSRQEENLKETDDGRKATAKARDDERSTKVRGVEMENGKAAEKAEREGQKKNRPEKETDEEVQKSRDFLSSASVYQPVRSDPGTSTSWFPGPEEATHRSMA